MKNIFTTLIITALATASCSKEQGETVIIPIDVTSYSQISLTSEEVIETIPLAVNEGTPLGNILSLKLYRDTILVWTKDLLTVYNRAGVWLHTIGRAGSAPGEYLGINGFFIKDGQIFINDYQGRKIVSYTMDGEFAGEQSLSDSTFWVNNIEPFESGNLYVTRDTYRGEESQMPVINVLDSNLKRVASSAKRERSGYTLPETLFPYKDMVLYWEMLCDTIFSIDERANIESRYIADFGEYTLPPVIEGSTDLFLRFQYLNIPYNIERYATMISNIRESDRYLLFSYLYGHSKQFIARYDKRSKRCKSYIIGDSDKGIALRFSYMTMIDEDILVALKRSGVNEDNPVLFRIRL